MSKRKTTEEFINEAKIIHGDKYDYSKVAYVTSHTKITVVCPIHGLFEQQPANHLQGKGCKDCANEKLAKERVLSHEQILQNCATIHDNKYVYDLSNYKNYHSKITITCPIHGNFEQSLTAHIHGKQECPACSNINRGRTLSPKEFIERSIGIHGETYSYINTSYTRWANKVVITCSIHGDFKQSPSEHLAGCGCPNCANHGFNPNKSAYLYYLKITTEDSQILYKIGITNRTVQERFNLTDLAKIEIVKQKLYENGQDAWDLEQFFKKKYKKYQYKGPPILSSGNTEIYTEDIYGRFSEKSQ